MTYFTLFDKHGTLCRKPRIHGPHLAWKYTNMESVVVKLCVWILLADLAVCSDTSCQDVDHAACISMSQQNPHMCEDAVLGRSVCPKICNNCPLTCYSCSSTSYDVTSCNTITCSQHQKCMIQSTHGAAPFTLGCVADPVCNAIMPGTAGHGTGSMTCCGSDLCNVPMLPTAPSTTIKSTGEKIMNCGSHDRSFVHKRTIRNRTCAQANMEPYWLVHQSRETKRCYYAVPRNIGTYRCLVGNRIVNEVL